MIHEGSPRNVQRLRRTPLLLPEMQRVMYINSMAHLQAVTSRTSPLALRIKRLASRHLGLWLALAVGAALKVVLLATGSVGFHADEAVIGLMARHILQGAHPTFFYGQSYMGALDAYLVALSFLIFGQRVLAIRVVQVALYLGTLTTTYLLTYRLSGAYRAAGAAALLVAMPPVLVSVYTTATLGDYGETLLLNNLLLLIGWGILSRRRDGAGWWLLMGLLAGLGWWSMALIITALLPLGVIGLWRLRRALPPVKVALLIGGFAIGAGPWIAAVVADPAAIFGELFGVRFGQALAEGGGGSLAERALSLVAFNLPALFGLRPPWALEWIALPLGLAIAALYVFILWQAARRILRQGAGGERLSLLGGWGVLIAAFLFSPFGSDPTGRYLLPLYPLLAILSGEWLGDVAWHWKRPSGRWAAPALLGVILAYNLGGTVQAMVKNPPGLTTQFSAITHIPNEYDDDLIAFLDAAGEDRGYSTYWVAYRLAFLTGERIILAPLLPYKVDMRYTTYDLRYLPHLEAVQAAEHVVYVTANHPMLDAALRERFAALGVSYQETQVGPYTVFYDLSRPVGPEEAVPYREIQGREIPKP